MIVYKVRTLSEYVALVNQVPGELENLYGDLLISVTKFFRNPDAFRALTDLVFPEIVKHRKRREMIRFWVPGCSTGEEAYTLAILFSEFLDRAKSIAPELEFQIFASDIKEQALAKARAGHYAHAIDSEIPAALLSRYFVRRDGGFQVVKKLRDACVFARQDITRDPPFSKLDLISCRNVLIYLERSLQKKGYTDVSLCTSARRLLIDGWF